MQSWRELEGLVLDGQVRLDRLLSTEPSTAFSARLVRDPNQSVLVRFLRERPGDEQLLARCMEASYLSHPNLVRCFGAGVYETGASRYVYVITEGADAILAHILQDHALTLDEVRDLGRQLAAGLSYLHERNLVCCSLETSTVAKCGTVWKIADYSQLRVPGHIYAAETRRLLAKSPAVPPEAYEGVVSPAWDTWSLATVLTAALDGPKGEARDGRSRRRDFPEPIGAVISECLSADPKSRCDVSRIAELLSGERGRSAQAPEPSEPRLPLETRSRIDATPRRRRWPVFAVGGGAVAAGALLAALTLNSNRPSTEPQARPAPRPAAVEKPAPELPVSGDQDRATTPAEEPNDGAQIYAVLNGWITSSRNRDLDTQSSFYAPEVDRFYEARHVTPEWVKQNREKALSQVEQIRELSIDNVHVRQDRPDHAVATFDKSWDFGGGYSGKVKQQLELRKLDDNWRITSERDIHVYRVSSGHGRRSPST
jgi:hypothetical protein